MKFYAIFESFQVAMRAVEVLLEHEVLLNQVSLFADAALEGPARTERLESLSIEGFGRIWGLGELSQAAAVRAGTSPDGLIDGGLATVFGSAEVPAEAIDRYGRALRSGGAVLEVTLAPMGQADPDAIEHLLAKYGATVVTLVGENPVL